MKSIVIVGVLDIVRGIEVLIGSGTRVDEFELSPGKSDYNSTIGDYETGSLG